MQTQTVSTTPHTFADTKSGTIKDLFGSSPQKHLVLADQYTSLREACALLQQNNISAIPIFDNTKQIFIGLVDITDICLLVVYAFIQKSKEAGAGKISADAIFRDVKVADLLQIADEGKLAWSFSPEENVEDTMEAFSKGVHRAIVHIKEGSGLKYHILSQRDAIKFLLDRHQHDDIFNSQISDLPDLFAFQPPHLVTIDGNTPAIEGFKKIGREHFGALAVVDDKGCVVASLCATDLRSIDEALLRSLLLPTNIFLKIIHENNIPRPLTATSDDTLGVIVKRMLDKNEHRVWMLDGQGKLSGVVTLSDVCKLFIHY